MKLRINLVLSSINISKANAITGSINIQVGEIYFPNKGWNDFIVIVLTWWNTNFYTFIVGKNQIADFYFMDGNYKFRLKSNNNILNVQFYDSNDEVISIVEVSKDNFLNELYKKSNDVVTTCQELGLKTQEVIELQESLLNLGELLLKQ